MFSSFFINCQVKLQWTFEDRKKQIIKKGSKCALSKVSDVKALTLVRNPFFTAASLVNVFPIVQGHGSANTQISNSIIRFKLKIFGETIVNTVPDICTDFLHATLTVGQAFRFLFKALLHTSLSEMRIVIQLLGRWESV